MADEGAYKDFVLSVYPMAEERQKTRRLWTIVDGERSVGSGETPGQAWEVAFTRIHRDYVMERHPSARAEAKGLTWVGIKDGRALIASGARESKAWASAAELIREREAEEEAAASPQGTDGPRA